MALTPLRKSSWTIIESDYESFGVFWEGAIFLGEDWAVSQSLLSNRQIMSNLTGGWIPYIDQHLDIFHDGIVGYGDAKGP